MSSYLKNTSVERTLYATNFDVPVTGLAPADVTVKYKKAGQTTLQTFVTNTTNWIELGGGYYTLIFGANDADTVGTFIYTVTSADFNNLIFDQYNIVDSNSTSDQQAYFQDVACERTVYIELVGVPAISVDPDNVLCQIKKAGQIGFSTKDLSGDNWINLGEGFYTIKFSAADMSRVGSFIYKLEGDDFDNFAYDEFVILPASDTTVADKCIVSGQFVNLAASNPGMQVRVSARPVEFPARIGDRMVTAGEVYTFLDHTGSFELPLLRGSTCIFEVPRAAIRHQIEIPDAASANLIDLLPPFVIDYSL